MNGTAASLLATGALLVGALVPRVAAQSCVSDLDGDRNIDQADIGILLGNWGVRALATPTRAGTWMGPTSA